MRKPQTYIGLALFLLALMPLLQIDARNYILQILIFLFLNITLAQSYDIVGGQMGYINLGHITFFGVGAYGFGVSFNAGFSFVPAFIAGTLISVLFALVFSYPFFRLRGHYFALASFSLVKLMEYLTINMGEITGGSNGLKIHPAERTVEAYYLMFAIAIATVVTGWWVSRSRLGLAMKSIREDEEVAKDFGVPALKVKVQALVISAVFPAMLGCVYTWYLNFIDVNQVYGMKVALTPIAMAMLGGTGLIIGPFIGAVFLYAAEEIIWTNLEHLHGAILGLVVILVGLFMPGGLARLPWVERVLDKVGLLERDR